MPPEVMASCMDGGGRMDLALHIRPARGLQWYSGSVRNPLHTLLITYMLLYGLVIDVQEYIDPSGKSPFGKWFASLNVTAAAKVTAVLEKLARGNLSNVESVGAGVYEYKLDWGPGYRIYFGRDGEKLVILLGGGTKKRQPGDITAAKACWAEYKKRKKKGEK